MSCANGRVPHTRAINSPRCQATSCGASMAPMARSPSIRSLREPLRRLLPQELVAWLPRRTSNRHSIASHTAMSSRDAHAQIQGGRQQGLAKGHTTRWRIVGWPQSLAASLLLKKMMWYQCSPGAWSQTPSPQHCLMRIPRPLAYPAPSGQLYWQGATRAALPTALQPPMMPQPCQAAYIRAKQPRWQ